MIIGVSDDGEITGVPMSGTCEDMKVFVQEKIIEQITKLFSVKQMEKIFNIEVIDRTKLDEQLKTILPLIKVNIHELESNTDMIDDDIDEIIDDYNIKYDIYEKKVREYHTKRKKWVQEVEWHRRAINKMIMDRDVRDKMIVFIDNYDIKKFQSFYLDNVINGLNDISYSTLKYPYFLENFVLIKEIIKTILKSDIEIQFNTIQILSNRYNPSDISFWITQFRDSNVDELMKIRPKKKTFIEPTTPYFMIIKNFNLLTKRALMNGIKFCLIEIILPSKDVLVELGINEDFYFVDLRGNIKVYERKIGTDGMPCCI
jgi:hypothetical protein